MKETTLKQIALWCGGKLDEQYSNIVVNGICTDSREVKHGNLFIPLVGAHFDGHNFLRRSMENGAVAVLSSRPKIPEGIPTIFVDDTLAAFGAIATGYRESLPVKVLGITGSVGKTTTKEMLAAIMRKKFRTTWTVGNFNNNLGVPITVMEIEEDTQVAVLELGMNHFGEMAYLSKIAKPDAAIFTNIGTMHIEHLGSREGILKAKMEILDGMKPDASVILNGDEPLLWNLNGTLSCKCYYFGIENPRCEVRATNIRSSDAGVHFHVTAFSAEFDLFVPANGNHTVYNALAAVTAAVLGGVDPETIQEALSSFENSGMRQKVYEKKGFTIIEDCYNAGPESMAAALSVLGQRSTTGRRIAVLGDMLELGSCSMAEHYRVGRLALHNADLIFAYGSNATRVVTGAVTGGMNAKSAMYYDDQDQLIHELKARAKPGDVLLFKGSRGMKMERVLELFLKDDE